MATSKVKSYEDLGVWQRALDLVTEVYRVTRVFPKEEQYGLTSQLRRAAVSVPSNIAEGQSRLTTGEFKHFLGNAKGSISETETQIRIANRLEYIDRVETAELLKKSTEISRMLSGLIASLSRMSANGGSTNTPLATRH